MITDIFKPNERVDPLFGVVKFRRGFIIIGTGYWDGKVHFEPLEKSIDVHITAGKSDDFKPQREFYRQIEQRYADIIDRTLKILYETLHQYMPSYLSEYTREEILADCELDSVAFPSAENLDSEWSLSFMYVPHKQSYSIYFDGWKPIYGLFDD